MDFNLKQCREQQQHESDQESTPCAKLPRLLLDSTNPQHNLQQPPSASAAGDSSALPLFVTEPTSISKLSSNLSAAYPTPTDSTPTAIKYPRGGMGSSYFSLAQWQELELQASIFRHMIAGAAVPPELLHHLVKKSLLNSCHHHPYYLPHHPLHHYPPHLQPALLQSGYWGRASMDPEPGRCRRTDGKKWRCSRDVVAGQKYCEHHMHRGRNRSRKTVEIPSTHITTPNVGANVCGGNLKNNPSLMAQSWGSAMAAGGADSGSGTPHFSFSVPSPSIDLLHLSQRSSESIVESRNDVRGDDKSSRQKLRHFFDDWPRSLQDSENAGSNARSITSTTNLSISISGNPTTSDFSLKLSTGDGYNTGAADAGNVERERRQSNWGVTGTWGANQVASMGGPLAEALRSSTSNSSPTSVLHQLQRGSASETSYVSN